MHITYDIEAGDVTVAITDKHDAYRWSDARTYGVAHDPVRGRVGAVVVPHPSLRPVRIEQKDREISVILRMLKWAASVTLDSYVTIDLDERGVVMAVRVIS